MLYWEAEDPALGAVHHLMVLCYHLQHPGLYSPEGLSLGRQLLTDFVEGGVSPQEVRRHERDRVDSGKRAWMLKGTPERYGSYGRPVRWSVTTADVVAGGVQGYCEHVRRWAQSVQGTLKALS
jgi:hypothetical protein